MEREPCCWLRRVNIDKMSVFFKHGLQIQCHPKQKAHSKIYIERQTTLSSQHNAKEEQIGGLVLPDFKA